MTDHAGPVRLMRLPAMPETERERMAWHPINQMRAAGPDGGYEHPHPDGDSALVARIIADHARRARKAGKR